MKFEMYSARMLGRLDVAAVDMEARGFWGMNFSHHAGHNTPPAYRGDLATEAVLKFIQANDMESYTDWTVTNNHFDTDGVLAVWSMIEPELAQQNKALLTSAARAGDFGVVDLADPGTKMSYALEELAWQARRWKNANKIREYREEARFSYDLAFHELPAMVNDIGDYPELWSKKMSELEESIEYLRAPGRVVEAPEALASIIWMDRARVEEHAAEFVCKNDLIIYWHLDRPLRRIYFRHATNWYELASLPDQPEFKMHRLMNRLNELEGSRAWETARGSEVIAARGSRLQADEIVAVIAAEIPRGILGHVPESYVAQAAITTETRDHHITYYSYQDSGDGTRSLQAGGLARGMGIQPSATDAPYLIDMRAGRAAFVAEDGGAAALEFSARGAPGPGGVTLEVDYLDAGRGRIELEYDAAGDSRRLGPEIELAGSGEWRTLHLELHDAVFSGSLDRAYGRDFRFVRDGATPLVVSEVRVSPR
jgi:Family of unknown function (DUF6687)